MSRVRDGTINFSKLYTKLYKPIFPTIRYKSDHGGPGHKVAITIEHDRLMGLAGILHRVEPKLNTIPTGLLTYDTETDSRKRALKELKKYYPDLEPDDQVELYILGWIDRGTAP